MRMTALPFRTGLEEYERQAAALLDGWLSGNPEAVSAFRGKHPRLLDETVRWLPKKLTEAELRSVDFDLDDARLVTARGYSFGDWSCLVSWVEAISQEGSPVERFESAVEAVIDGDTDTLAELLRKDAELVQVRSAIVTHHDPPEHGATLLHYVAANGVEGYRQKSPANAVEIAKLLLEAGAEPDALAAMYGGQCTTMSMLVSSCHPADAGGQVPLVETLLDYGAAVDPTGSGEWTSPLMTALVFGYPDAAEALVRRGAPVANLPAAAGLGRLEEARRRLPEADPLDRHRALALAAQLGHAEVVGLLLDAGEDPDRSNPPALHAHATPLHQAALAGHLAVVRLMVERRARLDLRDTLWEGTPLGWAKHGGKTEVAEYLRSQGAPD
jgi:ankyrin repeat protein